MKKIYVKLIYLVSILIPSISFSFSGDVHISGAPEGKHSAVVKNNDTIFVSVPVMVSPSNYSIEFYQSSDTGATWALMSTLPVTYPSPIVKSKMLISGVDSMYCIFQTGDSIYTFNFQSNSNNKYTSSFGIADFDAVASPNNNAIYLIMVDISNDNLKWTSSLTGGTSWITPGLIDFVATSKPKVVMHGTTLLITYYGSTSFLDPQTEVDRYRYRETAPGTLTYASGGFFGDGVSVMTDFCETIKRNYAWFIYTIGSTANSQSIYGRTSIDSGYSWSSPFLILSNAGTNKTFKYLAINSYFIDTTNFGCDVTYYADDTLLPASSTNDQMLFITASYNTPSTFSSPVVFSDFTVSTSTYDPYPIVVEFSGTPSPDRGIVWMEDNGAGSGLWYDRFRATLGVGIVENDFEKAIYLFPNPSEGKFSVELPNNVNELEISNTLGQLVKKINVPRQNALPISHVDVDVSELTDGTYFLTILVNDKRRTKLFVIASH